MRRVVAPMLLVAISIAGCASGPERADVVAAIGHDALLPLLTESAESLADLDRAVAGFCTAPSQLTLDAARESWHLAKSAWERNEVAVFYGPAPMLRTESKVDYEPVSPEGIDELLASDAVIDHDYVDNRIAASRRGLGTIELGLFDSLAVSGDPRRCELTMAATTVAAEATGQLLTAWSQGADDMPPHIEVFTTTMDSNDALADVVGAQFEILNRQTLFELGKALGVSAPGPVPDAIPEGPAGAGVERYVAQLEGIDATLGSGGEASLLGLIRSRSTEVADEIETRMSSALAHLGEIEGDITTAVSEQPEEMNEILDDLTALRDLFHVDVVALLDLTLGFSDSDGDSG